MGKENGKGGLENLRAGSLPSWSTPHTQHSLVEIISKDRFNGGKEVPDNSGQYSLSVTCVIALNLPTLFYRWRNGGLRQCLILGTSEGHTCFGSGRKGWPGEGWLSTPIWRRRWRAPMAKKWMQLSKKPGGGGGRPHSDSANLSSFPHYVSRAHVLWRASYHSSRYFIGWAPWGGRSMWRVASGLNESHSICRQDLLAGNLITSK